MQRLPGIFLAAFLTASLSCMSTFGQEVRVNANLQPLSNLLLDLRGQYGLQFSFDHQLLSECLIVKTKVYQSAGEAVADLISNCDLAYEFVEGTYVIYYQRKVVSRLEKKSRTYHYAGQLLDPVSKEPLPFSTIQLDKGSLLADANGNFTFNTNRSVEKFQVSHIGYYQLDTLITPGSGLRISLQPEVTGLQEIVVSSDATLYNVHMGQKPGLMKLNASMANLLPGNNNNTLFNLLRLQPGILAAAERSGEYVIWGSYRGHNLLVFDGIPLLNTTSQNSEIGIVNPLMVNDVEVFKGGYGVDLDDRVGGIINVTGKTGNPDQIGGELNFNTETVSARINIPVNRKIVLQSSFRKSFDDIFNTQAPGQVNITAPNVIYSKNFSFRDMNVKLSGKGDNGDNFYVSLLSNDDDSSFELEDERKFREKAWENSTNKKTRGATAFYSRDWGKLGRTQISATTSSLNVSTEDIESIEKHREGQEDNDSTFYSFDRENEVVEHSLKVAHQWPLLGHHAFTIGGNIVHNRISIYQQSYDDDQVQKVNTATRLSGYIKDHISVGSVLTLQPGIKIDHFPTYKKTYIQPRIAASFQLHEYWRLSLATGKYNQYVVSKELLSELGNRYYAWELGVGNRTPIASAQHYVATVSYNKGGTNISMEGYLKKTDGISRQQVDITKRRFDLRKIGLARTYGVDFFVGKEVGKHELWVSYSLSRAEEYFPEPMLNAEYVQAFHDQTHEVKLAALLDFRPFYVSANHVYGSGLFGFNKDKVNPYARFDLAFLYKFNMGKFKGEIGASVVNLFNTKNVGYSGFSKLREGNAVRVSGVRRRPGVFLNISL